MMEYIERKVAIRKIKVPEDCNRVQISINDWGHLTVRFFNIDKLDRDILIVFDEYTTRRIVGFIKNISRGYTV